MKNIFINPALQYIRPGWRIGIFTLILTACTLVIGTPVALLVKYVPGLKLPQVQTLIMYISLTLATWLTLRFVDKRPLYSVGLYFHGHWKKELGQGILIGAGMMSVIAAVFFAGGMMTIEFRSLSVSQVLFIFSNSASLYIVVGYGEELLFRGYILQIFAEGTNRFVAALLIALLFSCAHIGNPNVSTFGLINVGLAGIWLAIAYYKTNTLWLPIGMHISWNFFQGFVYSLPVSGTTSEREQIGNAIVTGAEWLTGGKFGPEGGALATLMLVIGSLVIYKWNWFQPAEGAWRFEEWKAERIQQLALQQQEQSSTVS